MHPKDKIKDKIPNQTTTQRLEGLIVQGQEEKPIRQQPKQCVVFRHEYFGGQPLWCLAQYIKILVEGLAESFFVAAAKSPPTGVVGETSEEQEAGATATTTTNAAAAPPNTGTVEATNKAAESNELPLTIQRIVEIFTGRLDEEDLHLAAAAAPMIDNDTMPALENVPQSNNDPDDIMIGWQHSGICKQRNSIQYNHKPLLTNFPRDNAKVASNLQIFELLVFTSFIKDVILPSTNEKMVESMEEPITYGKFLCWLGLWMLMATIISPQ